MHLTLRMPVGCFVPTNANSNKNVLDSIHSQWKRVQSLSNEIRDGSIRSTTPIVDVLVIGGSVVSSALEFIYNALLHDKSTDVNASLVTPSNIETNSGKMNNMESIIQTIVKTPFKNKDGQSSTGGTFRKRKLHILNSVDPSAFMEATSYLSSSATCVITLNIDEETEEECQAMTMMARNWLVAGNTAEAADIVKKQMYLVTTKANKKTSRDNTFLVPNHSSCESFASFSAAGLLPLSIIFGWDVVSEMLAGAHMIDRHFTETNPRHNLAVLLGLIDVWNDAFMNIRGRIVKPCLHEMSFYPRFVNTLEHQVLSGENIGEWKLKNKERCDPGNNHSGSCHFTEFVTAMDPTRREINNSNDSRICLMLQQADTLAFGNRDAATNSSLGVLSPGSPPAIQSCDSMLSVNSAVNGPSGSTTESGNHPSTLLICGKCDAFSCGQLVALAEHRALVKAWLWGVDPFDTHIPTSKVDGLKEELDQMYQDLTIRGKLSTDEADQQTMMNGSTKTLLRHYAVRMQRHRNNEF